MSKDTYLVTGAAGFIGAHTCQALAAAGQPVVGLDNYNDYYDPQIKRDRVAALCPQVDIRSLDLTDRAGLEALFEQVKPRAVIHLAAQAGVRYSLENPQAYVDSNLTGFVNILELCRHHPVEHLVYASSSSVYGDSATPPFSEDQRIDRPRSLYAATKAANELMAYTYAQLFGLKATGLRFFTVYGPWGRPDMALFLFTRAILAGEPIKVFNHGKHKRSFTYVDDIVEGVIRALDRPPGTDPAWNGDAPDPASSGVAPYRIYNIGNEQPVELLRYIEVLEQCLGRKAQMELLPLQAGDVPDTEADVSDLIAATGYRPQVSVEQGVANFVAWYQSYYP